MTGALVLWVLVCWMTTAAGAQQVAALQDSHSVVESLPDAPVMQGQAIAGQATGVIFGTVKDSDGKLVAGARVTLASDAMKGE